MSDEVSDGQIIPTDATDSEENARSPSEASNDEYIRVRHGRIKNVIYYDVLDSELQTLENGSPSNIYFSIFLSAISVFVTFIASILTGVFPSTYTRQTIFIVFTIFSGGVGIIFLFLWLHFRKDTKDLFKIIRARLTDNISE